MKKTIKTYLTIDELPEDERQKQINKHREMNVEDCDWAHCTIENAVDRLNTMGFQVQEDNINWDLGNNHCVFSSGSIEIDKLLTGKLREKFLPLIIESDKDNLSVTIDTDRGGRSMTVETEFNYNSEYDTEEDELTKTMIILKHGPYEVQLDELVDEIQSIAEAEAKQILKELQEEYDSLTSDEYILSELQDSGYLFDGPEEPVVDPVEVPTGQRRLRDYDEGLVQTKEERVNA